MPVLAILPQGNGWPQAGAGFQQGLLQEELGAPSPAAPSHGLPGSLLFLGGRMALLGLREQSRAGLGGEQRRC